jgi:hypothetical protein
VSGGVFNPEAWGACVWGVDLRGWGGDEPALQAWLAAVRTAR